MKSKVDPSKRAQHLRRYIESSGAIIPDDLDDFHLTAEFGSYCPLCGQLHDDIPLVSPNPLIGGTKAYICIDCDSEIKRTMASSEVQKRINSLHNSLKEDEDFPVIHNANQHLIGLDVNTDPYASKQHHCYVCNQYIREPLDYIKIPARNFPALTGGKIAICKEYACQNAASVYTRLLKNLQSKGKIQDVQCPTCKNYYYIVGREVEYRRKTSDKFDWQCMECALRVIGNWHNNPLTEGLAPNTFIAPREEVPLRYKRQTCSACNEPFTIDYMLTEFSIFHNHVISFKYVCEGCNSIHNWLDKPEVFRVPDTRIYIEINEDFTFSSFRLKRGELEPIITNGNTDTDSKIEALFVASDEMQKLIGTQTTLWND